MVEFAVIMLIILAVLATMVILAIWDSDDWFEFALGSIILLFIIVFMVLPIAIIKSIF